MCMKRINKTEFSLDDVYTFESVLQGKRPENNNVKGEDAKRAAVAVFEG